MQVNIHEAKSNLSRLLEMAANGEEIIIAKAGTPVAKLIAIRPEKKIPRKLGGFENEIWIADDFDAPLPDDLLAEFEK